MKIEWMDCPKCNCETLEGEYWEPVICTNCGFDKFYWDSQEMNNGDEWILLLWLD